MNVGLRSAVQLLVELSGHATHEWATLNAWGVRLPATVERIDRCGTEEHVAAWVIPNAVDLDVRVPLTGLSYDEADELAGLLGANQAEQDDLREMESGRDVARWLLRRDGTATLEASLASPWKFWLRSAEDHEALLDDWLMTARAADASPVVHFAMAPDDPVNLSGIRVTHPVGDGTPEISRPTPARAERGAPEGLAGALDCVADLACWMHLAASMALTVSGVEITLHEHQQPFLLTPDRLRESPESLLRWATSTPDPLREEALRHTLRLATAAGQDLPNPDQTVKSAAQYLLLFAQNRSAEVLRARDAAMASIRATIAEVTASVDESQRDAARDALASLLSAVGLVAASSRLGRAATVSGLVIVIATVVALMWTTTARRLSRMKSAVEELEAEVGEARTSPFLTPNDIRDVECRARLEVHRESWLKTRTVLVVVAVLAVISTGAVAALGFGSLSGWVTQTTSPPAAPRPP